MTIFDISNGSNCQNGQFCSTRITQNHAKSRQITRNHAKSREITCHRGPKSQNCSFPPSLWWAYLVILSHFETIPWSIHPNLKLVLHSPALHNLSQTLKYCWKVQYTWLIFGFCVWVSPENPENCCEIEDWPLQWEEDGCKIDYCVLFRTILKMMKNE